MSRESRRCHIVFRNQFDSVDWSHDFGGAGLELRRIHSQTGTKKAPISMLKSDEAVGYLIYVKEGHLLAAKKSRQGRNNECQRTSQEPHLRSWETIVVLVSILLFERR